MGSKKHESKLNNIQKYETELKNSLEKGLDEELIHKIEYIKTKTKRYKNQIKVTYMIKNYYQSKLHV